MSETFKAWVMDYNDGEYRWREYTRESLLQEVAAHALRQMHLGTIDYSRSRVVCISTGPAVMPHITLKDILRRIAATGLLPAEVAQVQEAWATWWDNHGDSVMLAREGVLHQPEAH